MTTAFPTATPILEKRASGDSYSLTHSRNRGSGVDALEEDVRQRIGMADHGVVRGVELEALIDTAEILDRASLL